MSNLVTFIRIHLMSYIDLWTRINQQEDRVHYPPKLTENCIQGGLRKSPFSESLGFIGTCVSQKKSLAHMWENAYARQ